MSRKYVIEIDEEHPYIRRTSHTNEEKKLYPVVGFNTLVFDDVGLQKLTPIELYNSSLFQNLQIAEQHLECAYKHLSSHIYIEEESDGQRNNKDC